MRFNKIIKEEFFKAEKYKGRYHNQNKYIEIFKNPSLKEYKEVLKSSDIIIIRGVLTREGDLYICSGKNIIHEDLLRMLSEDGIVSLNEFWYMEPSTLKEYLCLVSEGNKKLEPADSYDQDTFDAINDKYLPLYKTILQKKNPTFKL